MSTESTALAQRVRIDALEMVHKAGAAHIGSSLSIADILAVLYRHVLHFDPTQPRLPERDRFILSKGHAAAAGYAVLAETGFYSRERLFTYCANGSELAGHLSVGGGPGVEASTGSLGHGLSLGVGMAFASRVAPKPYRAFVLMSDGECDEGSVWEAALFAGHHHMTNLTAIVDYNRIQSFGRTSEVLDLEPLASKWEAFGWTTRECDGHDHTALLAAIAAPREEERPLLVVAHTVKGKGVSFMEDDNLWHYRPPTDEQLAAAIIEVRNGP